MANIWEGANKKGVAGVLDIINPILAGVSLGRGGKWGIAGGIGSLGAQIADAIWKSKKGKKKGSKPAQEVLPRAPVSSGPPRMSA